MPGTAVYGESLRKFAGKEHRRWDPNRSKLGAGLLQTKRDPALLLPGQGETVLYLGAGPAVRKSPLRPPVRRFEPVRWSLGVR